MPTLENNDDPYLAAQSGITAPPLDERQRAELDRNKREPQSGQRQRSSLHPRRWPGHCTARQTRTP
ncbi:hypothetical protein VCR4J5_670044 [Vibrio crassostreae]|uniref:Uncharacterized protein n=1 Tax=Vibrio crassostreae TaxID=246167 RepID=A0ABM9QX24_9VIBR|nr:hypothetical protein VCR4J5_670044 [Vibrio crassostreae]